MKNFEKKIGKNRDFEILVKKNNFLLKKKNFDFLEKKNFEKIFFEDDFCFLEKNDNLEIILLEGKKIIKKFDINFENDKIKKNGFYDYFLNFENFRIKLKIFFLEIFEKNFEKKNSILKKICEIFNNKIFWNFENFKKEYNFEIFKENKKEFFLSKKNFVEFLFLNFETVEKENNIILDFFEKKEDFLNLRQFFENSGNFEKKKFFDFFEKKKLFSEFEKFDEKKNGFIEEKNLEKILKDNFFEISENFEKLIKNFIFNENDFYIRKINSEKIFDFSKKKNFENLKMKNSKIFKNRKFDYLLFKNFINFENSENLKIEKNENLKKSIYLKNFFEEKKILENSKILKKKLKNCLKEININFENFSLKFLKKKKSYPNLFFEIKLNIKKF